MGVEHTLQTLMSLLTYIYNKSASLILKIMCGGEYSAEAGQSVSSQNDAGCRLFCRRSFPVH